MAPDAQNLLFIISDEHNPKMLGCYGHDTVRTPNLDRLAERGTRFAAAYTNSPICIPARAAFATGRYVHETRYWDNAHPYDGAVRSWGHRLRREGRRVEAIGKLHYRGRRYRFRLRPSDRADACHGRNRPGLGLGPRSAAAQAPGEHAEPDRTRRIQLQPLRPADRRPGEGMARGRGRTERRQAMGALCRVRRAPFPACGPVGILRSLPAGPPCRNASSTRRRVMSAIPGSSAWTTSSRSTATSRPKSA